ncbi:MAG: PepSY-associated TM helix domain-containing protein [Pseudomonadota bacterium]
MATSSEVNAVHGGTASDGLAIDTAVANDKRKSKTAKKSVRVRKVSYLIHSFVGLKLSILLSIVFLTGTLAVFYQEIDWLIYSEMRVSPQGEKLNAGEVYDRAKAQVTDGNFGYTYHPLGAKYTAVSTNLTLNDGSSRQLFIDPYTGNVNGTTSSLTVGGFLAVLHTSLYLPNIGRMFVNFFGILCLISLITGIINYPKFWRYFFRKPRFEKKTRIWMGDIHRLFAIWSLWFVLIMGITGTWWFYQYPLVHYDVAPQFLPANSIEPGLTHEDLDALTGKGTPQRLSSKEIVEKVLVHDPEFEVTYLSPPGHNGMAYTLWGTHRDILTGSWGSVYYVHPFNGEILGAKYASDMSALERVDIAMYPLHFGTWGNSGWQDLAVKTVWFVFGLLMTAMAISGVIIFYKRSRTATKEILPSTAPALALKSGWRFFRPWGGSMGAFKYLNWVAIWFMVVGLTASMTLQNEGTSAVGYKYSAQQVGDWSISMNAIRGFFEANQDPIVAGWQTNIHTNIEGGDPNGIKFMHVKINKPRTTRAPGDVIHGSVGAQHAHVNVPENIDEDTKIWLTLEDWNGDFYQASWPLMPDGKSTVDLREQAAEQIETASAESSKPAPN